MMPCVGDYKVGALPYIVQLYLQLKNRLQKIWDIYVIAHHLVGKHLRSLKDVGPSL